MSEEPAGDRAYAAGTDAEAVVRGVRLVRAEGGERIRERGIPDLGWSEHVGSLGCLNTAPTHVNTATN